VLLKTLWVCWSRWQHCASVGGVGAAVADEFALQVLRRGASEESARTCVGCWRSDVEPVDGGRGTAEYERRRAQAGWRR